MQEALKGEKLLFYQSTFSEINCSFLPQTSTVQSATNLLTNTVFSQQYIGEIELASTIVRIILAFQMYIFAESFTYSAISEWQVRCRICLHPVFVWELYP